MAIGIARYTVEEFDQLCVQPENAEKSLEYIGGEIVEVVSNNYASAVAARILIKIGIYVENRNLGYVTGADGGYQVSGERYIPDVAFISAAKQPKPSHDAYNPNPPDLAIEVLSPTDIPDVVRLKIANYLAADTLVWVVSPETKTVEVYTPGQPAKRLGIDGELSGMDVLPGFILAVKDIFPE